MRILDFGRDFWFLACEKKSRKAYFERFCVDSDTNLRLDTFKVVFYLFRLSLVC